MAALANVVDTALHARNDKSESDGKANDILHQENSETPTRKLTQDSTSTEGSGSPPQGTSVPLTSPHPSSALSSRRVQRDSPSTRTGPPRSFSYIYKSTPRALNQKSKSEGTPDDYNLEGQDIQDNYPQFSRAMSDFRGALEYSDPEQREKEREAAEKKEKYRQSRLDDSWNPLKWIGVVDGLQESPKDEKTSYFDFLKRDKDDDKDKEKENENEKEDQQEKGKESETVSDRKPVEEDPVNKQESSPTQPNGMHRSLTSPGKKHEGGNPNTAPKWKRLRSLLPVIASQNKEASRPGQSAIHPGVVNITDELMVGGLSTLMMRLWLERDERGNRRVPVLLHRLRIRISDSLHPTHGNKAVFRIECEYANGAARWVVYRQLRDFISLHTHYRLSNAYRHNVDALPEFPRTSLPYFNFLKKEGKEKGNEVGRADFAVLQRESLENYLIGLIRAVMFHPTSNRLAGFLEISALSISLAQSGGWQVKAGMLRVESASSKSGVFGRKNASWKDKKKQRWCAVRDSYLVALEEPGELTIWDVFLLDADFKIERPTRYYRQGLHLLHGEHPMQNKIDETPKLGHVDVDRHEGHHHEHGTLHKVKVQLSKTLHIGHHHHQSHHREGDHTLDPNNVTAASVVGRTRSNSSSSSSSSSSDSQMVDPSTNMNTMRHKDDEPINENDEQAQKQQRKKEKRQGQEVSKHTFYIQNSQQRLKLFAKNERQMQQWITALEKTATTSHWTGSNRFDSFAPIRLNVAAQWLVDGRDYMWNLSRAILLARERIYIHDWWLSPELQMRRPHKERYRLDKLLEKKAKEGVKIYIIIYKEVSSRTTPVDSNYTKQKLTALHENIMVQRSPSHFQTGTFYWAHHEKMCVIDEAIAFMGGIDLCFGRWDTAQHVLIDNPESGNDTSDQIWPGKDYSNGRVSDFYTLDKPEQDMYDRNKVPRMPWHDVGMHVVGQPARDLCRHFIQRWNHLLRIKNHSRTWPFLLPPPDFKPSDLAEQGLTGTCEMQICRSAGPWSLGTPTKVEHSIQNAYLKAIQLSEHFVYIENQFFITSTVVNDTTVENKIGDALVHRIIRAHRERTPWKCCIVIPLLPGFPFPVDHGDASAVRIILECQNRTICRGPDSIFARLRKEGIDPDDYIAVFSLRNWAKLPGNVLTTEMVYIHGKVCIVDDRLAIIGSANINERSQRGDRDSELAAVIRDTDMIDGSMAGKPFKVGRFAHTLRVRLMREHIGVDVDAMYEDDLMSNTPLKEEHEQDTWDPDREQQKGQGDGITQAAHHHQRYRGPTGETLHEVMDGIEQAAHGTGDAAALDAGYYLRKAGLKPKGIDGSAADKQITNERTTYDKEGEKVEGFASSVVPTLEEKTILEHRPPAGQAHGEKPILDQQPDEGSDNVSNNAESQQKEVPRQSGRTREVQQVGEPRQNEEPQQARVHDGSKELFGAPADASKNPQTDDEPPHARSGKNDASEEEQAAVHARSIIRKHLSAKVGNKPWAMPTPTPDVDPHGFEDPISDKFWKNVWVACAAHNTEIFRKVFHAVPDDIVTTWKQYKEFVLHHERLNKPAKGQPSPQPVGRVPSETAVDGALGENPPSTGKVEHGAEQEAGTGNNGPSSDDHSDGKSSPSNAGQANEDSRVRQPAKADEPFELWEREEMEELLQELRGHLVLYPTRFLEGEDVSNNFLFNADRLLPMPIYD